MATYTTLRSGSSGSEVKKLQQALVNAGYDVGSAGVDGIYGSKTAAAVTKYQQDNGLQVDGIAGNQTLGKLYGNGSTTTQNTQQKAAASPTNTTPDYSQYQYDASSDAAYQQALAALQQAQKEVPQYAGTYDAQIEDIYNQIVNRDKFSYDLNADMLYNQYKDQYVNLGQMAMKDSMGQAAALTGGYGSSYGQSVGQQQYDAYLQQLNDVVPELYGMALDQYNAEGEQLKDQFSMLGSMADDEYNKYLNSLDQYWQNVSLLKDQADDAYNRGYENWYNSYQMGVDADDRAYQKELDAYNKQQDSYDKLVSLITSTGYVPTADELKAAGMSDAQSKAYQDYYKKNNTGTGGSSSSPRTSDPTPTPTGDDTPPSGGYNNGGLTKAQVKELQNALGVKVDGFYGEASKKAAGGLNAKDAYDKYVNKKQSSYFTGTTYSEAVAYLKSKGVSNASGIMDKATWYRHKNAYNATGKGDKDADTGAFAEVIGNNSYTDYLREVVDYYLNG